jgi:hypothetical protein
MLLILWLVERDDVFGRLRFWAKDELLFVI